MKKVLYIMVATLFLVSCSQEPHYVRMDNVTVTGLKEDLLLANMHYVIYNPNTVRTKLRQSHMDIYYKDVLVGQGFLDKQIHLKPKDTIKVPVRCEIALEKLHRYYPELLLSDASRFKIKGQSEVSFLLNSFTIHMEDEIYLNTQNSIQKEIDKNISSADNFKIRSVEVNKLPTFSKTELNLQIAAKNNLPLDYTIQQIHLEFFIDQGEEAIAQWTLVQPLHQMALETVTIPVAVSVRHMDILKNVNFSWLTGKKVNFNISGSVDIKIRGYTFKVPIQDTLDVAMLP